MPKCSPGHAWRCFTADGGNCNCDCGGENHGKFHEDLSKKETSQVTGGGLIIGKWEVRKVYFNGKELNPEKSQKLKNHSPDGFNWGYGGSGPSQLALAILLECTTEKEALEYYQEFKWRMIANKPSGFDFEMPVDHVLTWLKVQKKNI